MSEENPLFIPHPELQGAIVRVKNVKYLAGICGTVVGQERINGSIIRIKASLAVLDQRGISLIPAGNTFCVTIDDIEIVCKSVLDRQVKFALHHLGEKYASTRI